MDYRLQKGREPIEEVELQRNSRSPLGEISHRFAQNSTDWHRYNAVGLTGLNDDAWRIIIEALIGVTCEDLTNISCLDPCFPKVKDHIRVKDLQMATITLINIS